jgi:hypothetical protein
LFFAGEGFDQIFRKADYLLLLTALAIPFLSTRALIGLSAAFFAGQSVTLVAAAYGLAPNTLWFPYLIQTLIAGSILFLTVENILGADFERRWRFSVFFGAFIGIGLSVTLVENLQFAGAHGPASVL